MIQLNYLGLETNLNSLFPTEPSLAKSIDQEIRAITTYLFEAPFLTSALHISKRDPKFLSLCNKVKKLDGKYTVFIKSSTPIDLTLYLKLPRDEGESSGGKSKKFSHALQIDLNSHFPPKYKTVARLTSKDTKEALLFFINEINMFRKLKGSSHIVEHLDSFIFTKESTGEKKGVMYQKLYSCDLFDLLNDSFMMESKEQRLEKIWPLFLQLSEGYAIIHSKGIVYGDGKTENVLLSLDENPRKENFQFKHTNDIQVAIADFGQAFQPHPEYPSCSLGTPAYLPPERMIRNFNNDYVPFAADVWSLGCIFCQLYVGQRYNPSWMDICDVIYRSNEIYKKAVSEEVKGDPIPLTPASMANLEKLQKAHHCLKKFLYDFPSLSWVKSVVNPLDFERNGKEALDIIEQTADHVEKVFNILKEYGEDLWPYLSEFKQDREVYSKLRDRFQLLYKEVVLDRLPLITEPVSQKRGVIQTITDLFLKLFSRRDPTSQRIATLERVIKGMLIPDPTKRFTIQQVKDSLLACL